MYIEDRLFSERTDEVLYSILMDEDEYSLYSEFCSLFSKKDDDDDEDEDKISEADIAKAAAVAAGATGVGAGVGKVLEHQGKKKLKGLVAKRALKGATIGGTLSNKITEYRQNKIYPEIIKREAERVARQAAEQIKITNSSSSIKNPAKDINMIRENAKYHMDEYQKDVQKLLGKRRIRNTVAGASGGGVAGAIEGAIEKHLKEKKLKGLIKKGAGAGLAAGTLASAGYLAHKAYKKKKD